MSDPRNEFGTVTWWLDWFERTMIYTSHDAAKEVMRHLGGYGQDYAYDEQDDARILLNGIRAITKRFPL